MSNQRKQSYCCSDNVSVLFDGAKSFWKSRTNLDILIVEHSKHLCVELIAYNSILGLEAPRIYLSSLLLSSKIDQQEVKEKLTEKKEALIRMKKNVNVNELTKEITVNMMTQYILSRLSIPNDLPAGTIMVLLLPNSGDVVVDESTQRMDIVCEKPSGLTPLDVAYQKKFNAGDFQNAINQLQNESLALQQATKMAELVTSSVDGFKLMMAEKMRVELEMRRKCSVPRLRWIKAINRVLVQNYCEIVRARLDRMAADEALRLEEAEALQGKTAKKQRPKVLRRSIDNSQLSHLPSLKGPGGPAEGLSVGLASVSSDAHKSHLPALLSPTAIASSGMTQSERRRPRASSNLGDKEKKTALTRKSFGQEHYPQYSRSERVADTAAPDPAAHQAAGPPSLIKSYNSISQKVLQPLSVPAGTGESRSIRIVNK